MSISRRDLVRMAAATAVAPAGVEAQSISVNEADPNLRAARESVRDDAREIATVKLPMAVEPAFHFKA